MNANLLQDYSRHISVLKESLAAKEEHYNMLQTDVSPLAIDNLNVYRAFVTLTLLPHTICWGTTALYHVFAVVDTCVSQRGHKFPHQPNDNIIYINHN